MAFQWKRNERGQERSTAVPPTRTLEYIADGVDSMDFVEAYASSAIEPVIASQYGALYPQDIQIVRTAHKVFNVTVPYAKPQRLAGTWTWDFDTSGGTLHVIASRETIAKYPGTATDHKQMIGVNDGKPEGVDIVIPVGRVNVSYRHPTGVLTPSHYIALQAFTGTVNNDLWFFHQPGEALFLGGRGSDGTEAEASLSYSFASSRNQTGLTIGAIAGIAKKGHHYLWVEYQDKEDSGKAAVQPLYVFVERIYEEKAFKSFFPFG